MMKKGYLVLETGDIFEGIMVSGDADSSGEVVFNTSMTGYQEILTDPSYAGQLMTFCYPLIGNYGINAFDDESEHIALSGVILSDLCITPSHYQSIKTFTEHLCQGSIPILAGVDTRAIVKKIRNSGTMKGILTTTLPSEISGVFPSMDKGLVRKVSTKTVKHYGKEGPHMVLMDFGYKKSMLTALLQAGCQVTVVPYHTTYKKIKSLKPDGVIISNGPGDPMDLSGFLPEIKKISENYPTLGICLGHQLIALAYGGRTEKLQFGHRGGNHPVKEMNTGKVFITSQNHGYVITDGSLNPELFQVTYRNVNDRSIEGMRHLSLPIETVQFHPEASPGPTDTYHIFQHFIKTIQHAGEAHYAATN